MSKVICIPSNLKSLSEVSFGYPLTRVRLDQDEICDFILKMDSRLVLTWRTDFPLSRKDVTKFKFGMSQGLQSHLRRRWREQTLEDAGRKKKVEKSRIHRVEFPVRASLAVARVFGWEDFVHYIPPSRTWYFTDFGLDQTEHHLVISKDDKKSRAEALEILRKSSSSSENIK